eukprot:561157-Amphidinium_carterae.1
MAVLTAPMRHSPTCRAYFGTLCDKCCCSANMISIAQNVHLPIPTPCNRSLPKSLLTLALLSSSPLLCSFTQELHLSSCYKLTSCTVTLQSGSLSRTVRNIDVAPVVSCIMVVIVIVQMLFETWLNIGIATRFAAAGHQNELLESSSRHACSGKRLSSKH